MKKRHLLAILPFFVLPSAFGGPNNTGYVEISEIKVWPTYIDVYSENNHVCSSSHSNRYVLSKDEKEMFSIALATMTARMKANINYSCDSSGLPQVEGIRVRPQ